MNLIVNGATYTLVKTDESDATYIEYDVFNHVGMIGRITKRNPEILYSAWNVNGENRGVGKNIREALESMIENIFYSRSYKGERRIKTLGEWIEGAEVKVEYARNGFVKHGKRVVRYDKAAGDLCIVIDNNKYFYYEFD